MRKALVFLLLVMILVSGTAAGADTDVSSLTDDQLLKIYRQIRAEAAVRGLTLTDSLTLGEGRYIVGQDIPPGVYLITCISTGAEDLSRSFGALGAALDGLDSQSGTSYTDIYSSLGSAFAALDEGVGVEIVGDYGTVLRSVHLKKGQSAALTLEGKVALSITDGSCLLEEK